MQSVTKAMRILSLFDVGHRQWRVADIARATGYDRTTVHRMVLTMEGEYILTRGREKGCYELGTGLVPLLFAVEPWDQGRSLMRPFVQKLADLTGETAYTAVALGPCEHGLDTMILDVVLTTNPFKPDILAGMRFKGLRTAHARVFLALSSPDWRAGMCLGMRSTATPDEIRDIEAFESEVDRVLSERVAYDIGGQVKGQHVVAGPILQKGSDMPRVALGVIVPAERGAPADMMRLGRSVTQVCEQASAVTGPKLQALIRIDNG